MNLKKQSAFTLLEVMIAMVIFAIGLLGIAGLQAAAMSNNQISFSRTIAIQSAYDMADRVRNNRGVNYAAVVGSAAPNCMTSNCTENEMASFDRYEWEQSMGSGDSSLKLINAVGFISLTGTTYTISVAWDETKGNLIPTSCTTPANIQCVSIEVER